MKRMKTVFRNYDECAHVWAQQKQQHGNAGGHRMFFNGPSIYSYGSHFEIARFIKPTVVLFTTKTYSPTTSTHIRAVRAAIAKSITVYDLPDFDNHNVNADYFIEGILNSVARIKKSRADLMSQVERLKHTRARAQEFLKVFVRKVTAEKRTALRRLLKTQFFTAADLNAFKVKDALHEDRLKISRLNRDRIKDVNKAHVIALTETAARHWADEILDLNRAAWLAGNDNAERYIDLYNAPVMLRIKGNEIETSRGAYVPVDRAVQLWSAIRAGLDIQGFEIGHYTVSGIHDKNLVIGCHRIPLREVARMARVLELTPSLEVI